MVQLVITIVRHVYTNEIKLLKEFTLYIL